MSETVEVLGERHSFHRRPDGIAYTAAWAVTTVLANELMSRFWRRSPRSWLRRRAAPVALQELIDDLPMIQEMHKLNYQSQLDWEEEQRNAKAAREDQRNAAEGES
jgi:hypothetical protein